MPKTIPTALQDFLTPPEIAEITSSLPSREFNKKELLYSPEDMLDSLFLIQDGEITLYYQHFDKKLILDVLQSGAIFGDIDFAAEKSSHFAQASQPSRVCVLKQKDFMELLRKKPELVIRFVHLVSARLKQYEQRMKGLVYDAKEKVLHQLEILEGRYHKSVFDKIFGRVPKVTHEKLAEYTGLTRETVTRAIQDLKKEGKVVMDPKGMVRLNCKECIPEKATR